jgi:hypothetical protein
MYTVPNARYDSNKTRVNASLYSECQPIEWRLALHAEQVLQGYPLNATTRYAIR